MVGAHDVVSVIRKCPFQRMSINRGSTAARFVYNQLVKVASRFFLLHRHGTYTYTVYHPDMMWIILGCKQQGIGVLNQVF